MTPITESIVLNTCTRLDALRSLAQSWADYGRVPPSVAGSLAAALDAEIQSLAEQAGITFPPPPRG